MGDGFKRITRRVTRLFKRDKDPKPSKSKKLTASSVIKPEESVPPPGARGAPKSTRRIERPGQRPIEISVLQNGVTHIKFNNGAFGAMKTKGDEVVVRDPITRQLSRKKLKDGMNRSSSYWNEDGTLNVDEEQTDW